MKKHFISLLFIIPIMNVCIAQSIDVVPQGGYTFRSTYYDGGNRIVFSEGPTYGGSLLFKVDKYSDVGLTFNHQDATANAYSYAVDVYGASVGINQYNLTFIRNFRPLPSDVVMPYFGLDLGAAHFFVKNGGTSRVKAGFGIKAGIKFNLSEIVSLRIQGHMNAPISGIGLGIGIGGGGVSVGGTANAAFFQFGVGGGLGFRLGGKSKKAAEPAPATN